MYITCKQQLFQLTVSYIVVDTYIKYCKIIKTLHTELHAIDIFFLSPNIKCLRTVIKNSIISHLQSPFLNFAAILKKKKFPLLMYQLCS